MESIAACGSEQIPMAKMFYNAEEAAERLGISEDELVGLAREGRLREFRDAGSVNYKVSDVDAMAPPAAPVLEPDAESGESGDSALGEILLEPADDSGIELAPSASDVVSLDESAAGGSLAGTTASGKKKEDTAVPSVGINVFDDDELEEHVDPLAQTAVTDLAGLGLDGVGSGSGILDLTRESDDTSLGRELLDEIYTSDEEGEEGGGEAGVEVGEATRAGLDAAADADTRVEPEEVKVETETAVTPVSGAVTREVIEYAPDAVSASLTAAMGVAVAVMWLAGLSAASMVRGITPSLLKSIYANLWMYSAGAVGAGVIAGVVAYLLAKRSR